jgi:hypothetical protein
MKILLQLAANLFTVAAGTRQGHQPFHPSTPGDGNSPVQVTVTLPCSGDTGISSLPPVADTNSTTTTTSLPNLTTLSLVQTKTATTASIEIFTTESLAQTE